MDAPTPAPAQSCPPRGQTPWALACALLLSLHGFGWFHLARGQDQTNPVSPTRSSIQLLPATSLEAFSTWLVDTKSADPRRVFSLSNGVLRISGDGLGYLATKTNFANYHLIAEYRWGSNQSSWGNRIGKARDSGIFLHATGPDGNSHDGAGAFKAAIECNLFQGASGDFLLIRGTNTAGNLIAPRVSATIRPQRDPEGWPYFDPSGEPTTLERWGRLNWISKSPQWQDLQDFRGREDPETSPGGWNVIECICQRDTIVLILNGRVINRVTSAWPSSGQILLQCEGSEIEFRRLELRPLGSLPPGSPATGVRIRLRHGYLLKPNPPLVAPGSLWIHLHGPALRLEQAITRWNPALPLLNLTLPNSGATYGPDLDATRLLTEARSFLEKDSSPVTNLLLTAYNDGLGAIAQFIQAGGPSLGTVCLLIDPETASTNLVTTLPPLLTRLRTRPIQSSNPPRIVLRVPAASMASSNPPHPITRLIRDQLGFSAPSNHPVQLQVPPATRAGVAVEEQNGFRLYLVPATEPADAHELITRLAEWIR